MDPASPFGEQWLKLSGRLKTLNEGAVAELEACWKDLHANLESQQLQVVRLVDLSLSDLNLETFRIQRLEMATSLLGDSVQHWGRRRPYRRALMAVEAYDRGIEDLIRSLPISISVSGTEAVDYLKDWSLGAVSRQVARMRRENNDVLLRALVSREIQKLHGDWSFSEGNYFTSLAQGIRYLEKAWETARSVLDTSVLDRRRPSGEVAAELQESGRRLGQILQTAETALDGSPTGNSWSRRSWPGKSVRDWCGEAGATGLARRGIGPIN